MDSNTRGMDQVLKGALPPGYRLHWYELGEVIGKGGFGITYAGRDVNLDQAVAVKEYFPQSYAARDATDSVQPNGKSAEETYQWGLRRFLDEAQTLAKFRHPSIVRVSSVFEANGTAYMAMDYERGRSLGEVIKSGSIRDESSLLAVFHPLLEGLEQVHGAGFIHRDIKPANIVIRENGSPVLLDFGAARQAMTAENGQLTTVGTRNYAPFEQFDGSGELKQGPWTDLYSLGALLYEIVTGERPVDSLQRGTALLEGRKDPLRPIDRGRIDGRFSTDLLKAIEHALAFRLADRPQSIARWRSLCPVLNPMSGRLPVSPGQPAASGERVPSPGASDGVANESAHAGDAVTEANPATFRSLSVMVVDDEPFVLNLAKRVLGRLGVERVTTAADGEYALRDLEAAPSPPDVILCDLDMPGMDGLELLRRLGEQKIDCGVILVSGHDERVLRTAEALGKAHDLDILGVLNKPVSPEPLGRLLGNLKSSQKIRPGAPAPGVTEGELDEAILTDGIIAVFQPKVSVRTCKVVGVEALARLRHPERGVLGPGAFIPLAERCGRMESLTEAVFKCAVGCAGAWQADGIELKLSVNITTDSLRDQPFPDRVIKWAAAEGLRPPQIVLELTETGVMRDVRTSLETLSRFRLKGVGLSIDDFGTGYSSLEQLRQVPFSELKIDRQFVAGASQDAAARAILESSVSLARRMDIEVVAEGVETREDWDLVEQLGCDMVQGYFVAKPMSPEEIPDWIAKWSAATGSA